MRSVQQEIGSRGARLADGASEDRGLGDSVREHPADASTVARLPERRNERLEPAPEPRDLQASPRPEMKADAVLDRRHVFDVEELDRDPTGRNRLVGDDRFALAGHPAGASQQPAEFPG